MTPVPEHDPNRPEWTCSACGEEWPCASQRARWLELYRGHYKQLGAHLGVRFVQMVNDLDVPTAELHRRLFGWVPWRQRVPGGVLSR